MYFYLGYVVLLYFIFILFPWWFSHGLPRAAGGWLLTPAYLPLCFCSRRYVDLATSLFVSSWRVFPVHLRTIVSLLIYMSLGSPVYAEISVCVWGQSFLDLDEAVQMEKAMAPHSSTLAWKIPWMEEPGGLQSMGSQRVGHDWATSLSFFTFMHWRRKWQPTPVFLPGESQGRGSLVGWRLWVRTELDTTEAT